MTPSDLIIPVVFCVDSDALVGLHVTASTVLASVAEGATLHFHILHDRVPQEEFKRLRDTLDERARAYEIHLHPIDPVRFRGLKWLGGWMTYVRLLIPEVIAAPRVIYLDADLIVYADILQLFEHDLKGEALGAVSWGSIRESNDHEYFKGLGRDVDAAYFNAGVLLIDSDQWRRHKITQHCLDTGNRCSVSLPSADQTILNHVFAGCFSQLPRRFNTTVTASRQPLGCKDLIDRIVHLVARPKPWDLFGFLNGQSAAFQAALAQTQMRAYRPNYLSWKAWRRSARLTKAYWKCIKGRIT